MFQGLSLDQAPPYKIPLLFYITGASYLVFLALLAPFLLDETTQRHALSAVGMTHLMTLGFFTHIMFGSLFQMLPVMLGTPYSHVERSAFGIYALLNGGTLLFITALFSTQMQLLFWGGVMLALAFSLFALLSLFTLKKSAAFDPLVKNFAMSFLFLFLGSISGFFIVASFGGIYEPHLFNLDVFHIACMLFGWVFLLINAVSYKILPMFFVAKEFPLWLQNSFYLLVALLLVALGGAVGKESAFGMEVSLFLLSLLVVVFAIYTIKTLHTRKRKRKDTTITLWYFAMANIIAAALLFILSLFIESQKLSFVIAFFALFGGIYALINAMLYKIVPFLTWFHLSSLMIFEAEMANVISKKFIELQVRLYFASYIAFLALVMNEKIFLYVGSFLFLLSSSVLLRNIVAAFGYYKKLMKQKPDGVEFT